MKKDDTTLFLAVALIATLAGCATKETPVTTPPVAGATSKEAVKTISSAEAQRQIDAVTNDKSVPETAKPGIIAQIKHNAGLQ